MINFYEQERRKEKEEEDALEQVFKLETQQIIITWQQKKSFKLDQVSNIFNVTTRKYQVFLGSHRIGRWGQGAQCPAFPVSKSTPTKV